MIPKCWCEKVLERLRRAEYRTDDDPWTWYQCPEHGYPDSAQSWKARAESAEAERDRLMEVIKRAYRAAAARDIEGVVDALLEAVEAPQNNS